MKPIKLLTILVLAATALAGCKKEDVVSESVKIEDAVFKTYLLANFDTNGDGKISSSEALAVETIDVSEMNISSLKGIEAFSNLNSLYCYSCGLTALNVTKNMALTYLSCQENKITSLDVSKNTALTSLSCDRNNLTSLNVTKNMALTHLSCQENKITSLDISKNPALTILFCDNNNLTSLDVSNNTALTDLQCFNNPDLTELFLKTGQTISNNFFKDDHTVIKYK